MKITRADVEYVAALAHLALTEEEIARYQKDLDAILTYIDQLNRVDTTTVDPMAQVLAPAPADAALRDDRLKLPLPRPEVLAAAPDATDTFVKVPKVIDR